MKCRTSLFLFASLWSSFLFCQRVNSAEIITERAVLTTKDALYISTGLSSFVDSLGRYGERRAFKVVQDLNLEPVVAVVGGGYHIWKTQQVSFRIKQKQISITPNQVSVSWSW